MTATVRVLAPAKINLHLEVLGIRADGFHELAMVMQSIDLADELICDNTADGQIQLSCDVEGLSTGDDNLISRAALLLRSRSGFNELGASIHLKKRIPIGAGLAGGSSDGAAALVALNTLWGLGHSTQSLEAMAADLGSDMPFCVSGGTQLCFGRGERLEACPSPASAMGVVLVKDPTVSVSTPWAYGECRRQLGQDYLVGEEAFEQRRQLPALLKSLFTHEIILTKLASAFAVRPRGRDTHRRVLDQHNAHGTGGGGACFQSLAAAKTELRPSRNAKRHV